MSEKDKKGPVGQATGDKNVVKANISASEEARRGVYSSQALVSHSSEEFVLDFCFFSPVQPTQGQLVSRVVMSPRHIKRFAMALQENLRKYEARHGEIPLPDPSQGGGDPPTVQ